MAELWRDLIARENGALAGMLSLVRVTISKSRSDVAIEFGADRYLSAHDTKLLFACMQSAFPAANVSVRVSYGALRDRVLGDVGFALPQLRNYLLSVCPGAVHFLSWQKEDWTLADGALTIGAPSQEGANYLKLKNVSGLIADAMQSLFGVRTAVNIIVTGSDEKRLQEINEARARENEMLAKAAAKELNLNPEKKAAPPSDALYGKPIHAPAIEMREITEDIGFCTVCGEVSDFDMKEARNGVTRIITFSMSDRTSSVNCKLFLGSKRGGEDSSKTVQAQAEALAAALKDGSWAKVRGSYRYDDYKHEMVLMAQDIEPAEKPVRRDLSEEKRVELHLHTSFSTMDACASPSDLIKQAAKWGHKAIAITDHGVVQAFPEAFGAAKKNNIKLIPGCEGYLIDDAAGIVDGGEDIAIDTAAFVVLDVETTGLNTYTDQIIEIGAVRIENGVEVAEFSQLINPGRPVPEKVAELTGISTAMLRDQPDLKSVMPDFQKFCEGAVLVAHNAPFDIAFFRRAFRDSGFEFAYPVVDTLALVRNQFPNYKNHKLGNVCKQLGISLANAHRAVHDARATSLVLLRTIADVRSQKQNIHTLGDLNTAYKTDPGKHAYHIILLAESQKGMENLYRLISEGHLNYFYRTPRIPRSLITKYREGLIVGSACEAGELFRAVLEGRDERTLERIAKFYDYLEIQPIGNNEFLKREGTVADDEGLRELNRKILRLGDKLHIPVCATGDVHFMEPTDGIFRAVLMASKGFEDADFQPPLYFRTTDDMLSEFAYLGEETARRVVIEAPNAIADRVGDLHVFLPHPEGKETFQPYWPEAEHELRELTMNKAISIYGENLPEIVQKRIDKELGAIIGYGFSTLYMIAVKLVAKSLSDGYIVGSRGSVGSSFVAFLSGITEVNSLPAHYICPKCKHYEFDIPAGYATGLDLPPKKCPVCGTEMGRDGFNIPFEVFLGFKGNKVPDIDLNFSGEYQPVAHNYIKELFGAEFCFRAGTIGTVAEKTAYGYVLKYAEERGLSLSNAEKQRLANGITGVKRTTGQHPAGMVVLPKEYSIYQFTPIQHPADDMTTDTITTHFDFSSMHDVLVKLDVLGHDDPTMLRKLQDLTGIPPQKVPLHDPEVFGKIISLFSGTEALGITPEELKISKTGTLGVPEFGTKFVRGMLEDTKPTSMEELIRISGLSHGTDVWLGNAADLVKAGVPLKECICTRDDIMNALIAFGVENEIAFKTMENVRKGKGLKPEMEAAIAAVDAPPWYIDSCKKIKYMFPRAHAVAYVTMALRIAYFKIFYPTAYYCCYLHRNMESFNASYMCTEDVEALRAAIEEIQALDKNELTATKADEQTILEMLIEMNLRGVHMRPIDIYKSSAADFTIDEDGYILPPISSLPGVGKSAAEALVAARADGTFISQDDMVRRHVAKSTVETLRQAGCLNGMPETSQVSLFEL